LAGGGCRGRSVALASRPAPFTPAAVREILSAVSTEAASLGYLYAGIEIDSSAGVIRW
jgi:hypothetical protein